MAENEALMLADGTLKGMLVAAKALIGGSTVEAAATAAGVTSKTVRTWRKTAAWRQVRMMAEEELRDLAVGKALLACIKAVEGDAPDLQTARFLVKTFVVDTQRAAPGRPSKADEAGVGVGAGKAAAARVLEGRSAAELAEIINMDDEDDEI